MRDTSSVLFHDINAPPVLDPLDIVRLQAVSQRLFKLGRDNQLWKLLTFDNSRSGAIYWGREKQRPAATSAHVPLALTRQQAASNSTHALDASLPDHRGQPGMGHSGGTERDDKWNERTRALANWDPSYPTEKVDWYGEYIARHAPLSMDWLQHPTASGDRGGRGQKREVQGMALFDAYDAGGANRVVAPLDDGSVCLWDISEADSTTRSRQGRIAARSKAGLLYIDDANTPSWPDPAYARAKTNSTSVVECISVDAFRKTAYVTVQSTLNEVDLSTLQLISHEHYPSPISALSEARHPLPLTVGTALSLHLHDPRQAHNARAPHHPSDVLDRVATFPASPPRAPPTGLPRRDLPIPAPLFQPGPLAILHLDPLRPHHPGPHHHHQHGAHASIFVAGRFPSILHYSRRAFPRLHATIHSGARLCSLASLPFDAAVPGTTLIAAGEYNGKGSLELYGLPTPTSSFSPPSPSSSPSPSSAATDVNGPPSTFKNRVSASASKLLSVAPHGTRLVYADANGALRWVERDGATAVRGWNIDGSESGFRQRRRGADPRLGGGLFGGGDGGSGGEVARKILTLRTGPGGVGREGLLVWTGERVGMVRYGEMAAAKEWEEEVVDGLVGREERIYGMTMRRALERQADEVRFLRGLGLGG